LILHGLLAEQPRPARRIVEIGAEAQFALRFDRLAIATCKPSTACSRVARTLGVSGRLAQFKPFKIKRKDMGMKTILYITGLAVVMATTGCVVPVRERTYVQRREYRAPQHHHWEHKGVPQRHYYYHDRY
jgi:hypothetical protein